VDACGADIWARMKGQSGLKGFSVLDIMPQMTLRGFSGRLCGKSI
jgi:hypothetical protein